MIRPDRSPDSVHTEALTVSDEIEKANVVTLTLLSGRWCARIGPPGLGLVGSGLTAPEAMVDLAHLCRALGWPFDETWMPRD